MTDALSGELFAGVSGLGMAVDEVFGTRPAWFCEFDAAPSKVLAHRYPEVPNYGDVTKVDFTQVPHTTVRAGGFPCQDVSLAGRRRGMQGGTRSGLWSEFARSIQEDRPDWVVIENVRGLLSADASGDMEPCPLCVGDNPEHVLRALGAVLGDLAELGFDAEWTSIRASDVGAPHGRLRVFILAWPAEYTVGVAGGWSADAREAGRGPRLEDGVTLLPTPLTDPETGNGHGRHLGGEIALLPTPAAGLHNDGESVESWSARRDRVKATGVNGNGMGMPLPIAVQLLPTPMTSYSQRDAEKWLQERPAGNGQVRSVVGDLGIVAEQVVSPTDWGPYTAAIHRWEAVTGRPAPAPVRHDGKGGKPRLNPELTEWMMGWPAGWVTDPAIGLSRAEQLKACGNGVVPQQAAAALRELLARPGVPSIREESSMTTASDSRTSGGLDVLVRRAGDVRVRPSETDGSARSPLESPFAVADISPVGENHDDVVRGPLEDARVDRVRGVPHDQALALGETPPRDSAQLECDSDRHDENVAEERLGARTVLDPASGSRMFYFDKADNRVVFGDIRTEDHVLVDGRALSIHPDIEMDFRALPFDDGTFRVVVFDPPHLVRVGDNAWMGKKYGKLDPLNWRHDLALGLAECFRVLAEHGVLIFKWNETQIPVSQILALTPHRPLVGHRSGKTAKTHWVTFLKPAETPIPEVEAPRGAQ